VDIDEARAATSPDGLALLAKLPPYRTANALTLGASLREAGTPATLAATVMTQARLRERARLKFGDFAEGMLFTPDGLEQATRLTVAALHAARFRSAGIERVADLTAGIGADAMAMSAIGIAVMAFETDEATAVIADHNLRHWERSVVVHADSLATVRDVDVDGAFADPARRSGGSRNYRPEDYTPPLTAVLALRDALPALGVKVGPGIPHRALPADAETEWVSVEGDVVEAGIWCGPLARNVGRGSLVVARGAAHALSDSGAVAGVIPPSGYVYEPDSAVIRAGLVAEVAASVGGGLLDATIAYVTADRLIATPFATAYRVLDDLPFGVKSLRSYLRARGIGRATIKKRGTAVSPEDLRRQLALTGDAEATIILTRVAGSHRVLIVEPADATP
jgi:hypothetical protein